MDAGTLSQDTWRTLTLFDCALISSDESFRHAVLAIIKKPGNQAKLALDLPLYARDLTRESLDKLSQAKPEIIFLDTGVSKYFWIKLFKGRAP